MNELKTNKTFTLRKRNQTLHDLSRNSEFCCDLILCFALFVIEPCRTGSKVKTPVAVDFTLIPMTAHCPAPLFVDRLLIGISYPFYSFNRRAMLPPTIFE